MLPMSCHKHGKKEVVTVLGIAFGLKVQFLCQTSWLYDSSYAFFLTFCFKILLNWQKKNQKLYRDPQAILSGCQQLTFLRVCLVSLSSSFFLHPFSSFFCGGVDNLESQ